jgi:predicted permease
MYPLALGASGLLLLLACANTTNLLLARMMRRRRDLAVRSAIGAGRWRLARGLFVEAGVIVVVATGLALLLARVLVALAQGERVFSVGPALDSVSLDGRVLGFAAGLGVLTTALFGLVPALAASRSTAAALGREGRTATRGGRRLRAALVCVQLALAVTLLASAVVLTRSLHNLRTDGLGLDPDGVVTFGINPVRLGYRGDRADALVRDTLDRLRGAAGVQSVGFSSPSPFWRGHSPVRMKTQPVESAPEHNVSTFVVSADYFSTLRIPLRAGRVFTEAEFLRARPKEGVGIINESLARQLFGDAPAVGQRLYFSRAVRGWELDRTVDIVGVVGDTRFGASFRDRSRPALYQPAGASPSLRMFFVRSAMAPAQVVAVARSTIRQVDPNVPIASAGPLQEEIDRLLPEERMLALLIGAVAVIATILGVAGVHAVIAHTVAERTRELGIRLALGASRRAVSAGVLRGVGVLAIAGLGSGLALFAPASRLLESRVYGISPVDPTTLALVSLLLVAAALAGAWLPTRRATRVDPVTALRSE